MGKPVYSHLYGNSDSSLPSSETAFSDDNVENWVGAAFINLDFKPDFKPYDMAFWIALSSSKVDDWVIASGVRKGKKISGRKCRTKLNSKADFTGTQLGLPNNLVIFSLNGDTARQPFVFDNG
jgi:hypothetical protein